MRLQLDEIIAELKHRLEGEKSIRNSMWLKDAVESIEKYKAANEGIESRILRK
ncbi:MAG: hypothetical protein HY394_06435 [Candidatus Diapherotrites archaeon]|nr:hypothetical protein [Candidatus Diapherotrites archaeon]